MEPSREKALWAGVLQQALNDALNRSTYNRAEYRDGDPRIEAREWIMQGGADFETVCGLAGVDPDCVRDAVLSGRVGELHLGTGRPKRRTSRTEGKAA